MTQSTAGNFTWFELLTSDPTKALEFYEQVVGWKTQLFGDQYTMLVGGQGPMGGVMKLPEQAVKMGAPPHWTSYVQVDDVEATVALAKKLGGQVYVEPSDIPTVGRFAVIADPQGASICLLKPIESMKLHDSTQPGEVCWCELLTTDQESAFAFYVKLFGWTKSRDFDMGAMGKYLIYGLNGKDLGGIMTKPKNMPGRAVWGYYIEVPNLGAAIERAKSHGARLLNGPHEVPGGAHIAQLADPQGAVFALHEQAKSAN